jgi:hypothetical protein
MARNIHLVTTEIDLCHRDSFSSAGSYMGPSKETTKSLFVGRTLCYTAPNIPR